MYAFDKLDLMVAENNGYLMTSDVVAADVSKTYLKEYITKRNMQRVAQGVYVTDDTWEDPLYILQLRNGRITFSHETALYLHTLTDREPDFVNTTVPAGYNATHLRKQGVQVYNTPIELFEMGRTKCKTVFGNEVMCYDMNRTICDIIKQKNNIEIQVFQTAIKEYMHSSEKNLTNLMLYADALKITDKVRLYTEVMLLSLIHI